jgi:hypothetical protein
MSIHDSIPSRPGLRRQAAMAVGAALLLGALGSSSATAQVVFATNFENGLPAAISAPGAAIEGVQGFAGLGPSGRQFSGSFLRYSAYALQPTTLTLANLPPHTSVDIAFLLAVVDSWDGVELLEVQVDYVPLFSHWFQHATGYSSSYTPPPGGLLSSGSNLGFGNSAYHRDSAYDLGVEPLLRGIPHTATSLTVTWIVGATSGSAAANWQGGMDESWAIDELRVWVSNADIGLWGAGCGQPPLWAMPASRAWPLLGTRMRTEIHEVPNELAFMAIGLSTTVMGSIPLPMPLDPFGLPGCRLLIAPVDFAQPCTRIGIRTALHELPIPNNPVLENVLVYLQAWAPAPGYNAAGIALSNGETLLLGRSF